MPQAAALPPIFGANLKVRCMGNNHVYRIHAVCGEWAQLEDETHGNPLETWYHVPSFQRGQGWIAA